MHAINQLYPGTGSHGELAGVGAVFCTFLRGDPEQAGLIAACLARHGLPRTPAELGLSYADFAGRFATRRRPPRPVHDPGAARPIRGGDRRAGRAVRNGRNRLTRPPP